MCLEVAWRAGPNIDEPAHLAAGLYHYNTGHFDVYKVNPPLPRLIFALPVYLAGGGEVWKTHREGVDVRPEWAMGHEHAVRVGKQRFRTELFLARCITIVVSVVTSWLIVDWTKHLYGWPCAVVAHVLWWTSPLVLHYSATITPDIWAAFGGILAVRAFSRWLIRLDVVSCLWAGGLLALSVLCKTSWLYLAPLWLVMIGWKLRNASRRRDIVVQSVLMGILFLFVVNACYGFQGTGHPIGEFPFVSEIGTVEGRKGTNVLSDSVAGQVPSILPADFVLGIDLQRYDFDEGKPSYLLGEWRERGWWYYYFVAFALKEPIGQVALFAAAVPVLLVSQRRDADTTSMMAAERRQAEWLLFACITVFIGLLCMHDGFSRYLRYVLPIYPFLCVAAGRLLRVGPVEYRRTMGVAVAFCILLAFHGQYKAWPHPHAYFNEIAGGSEHGHRYLAHGNIDWGEDLWSIDEWVQKNSADRPIFACSPSLPLRQLLDGDIVFVPKIGKETSNGVGYYLLSKEAIFSPNSRFAWTRDAEPIDSVGASHFVYEIK